MMNTDAKSHLNSPSTAEEQELCPQCLSGNRPGSHFCHDCGSPLSSYAATGPFETIFAEGYVYRQAAAHPQRLLVVLGLWVLFGLMGLAGGTIAAAGWKDHSLFSFLAGLSMLIFSTVLLGKTTWNYRHRRLPKAR